MGMLKYWKGKHLVLTKKDILDEFRAKLKKKKNPKLIDAKCLHWTPKYSQQNTWDLSQFFRFCGLVLVLNELIVNFVKYFSFLLFILFSNLFSFVL